MKYLGVDVAQSVIEQNAVAYRLLFASLRFATANLVTDSIPRGYQLVVSSLVSRVQRDALQHNSIDDVWAILRQWSNSDAKYFLLGSYNTRQRQPSEVEARETYCVGCSGARRVSLHNK